jgi:hypothetical protein
VYVNADNILDTTVFYIDSVNGHLVDTVSGAISADITDSVFVLSLEEQHGKGFQTDWRPDVSVKGFGGFDSFAFVTAADNAGPVINTVRNVISNLKNSLTNQVMVTISEPIMWTDGSLLTGKDASKIFTVWTFDTAAQAEIADTNRLKADTVTAIGTDGKFAAFFMTNGLSLSNRDSLAFRTNPASITDQAVAANYPNVNNRKVPVIDTITDTTGTTVPNGKLTIGPNPVKVNVNGGTVKFVQSDNWQSSASNGGTIISFKSQLSANDVVKGYIKVFDVTGNLVAYDENTITMPSTWIPGSSFGIYWSGLNGQGMRVAPGVYRVIINISAKTFKNKFTGNIGIKR